MLSNELKLTRDQLRDVAISAAEAAAPIFAANGWTYGNDDGSPTAPELAKTVSSLIESAGKSQVLMSRSGRWIVRRYVDETGCEEIIIGLELATAYVDPGSA